MLPSSRRFPAPPAVPRNSLAAFLYEIAGIQPLFPVPYEGETYLFEDYYVRVTGAGRYARGYQVHLLVIGLGRHIAAGLSEFMIGARHQPRHF